MKEVYQVNVDNGFWEKERNKGELIALIHSELSEALEALRHEKFARIEAFNADVATGATFKDAFQRWIKNSFEDELADVAIRLFDMAEGLNVDLAYHIALKLDYNKTRERLHGKKF